MNAALISTVPVCFTQWRNFGLKSGGTKLEASKAPKFDMPKVVWVSVDVSSPAKSGTFYSFLSMFGRILQILVSHA